MSHECHSRGLMHNDIEPCQHRDINRVPEHCGLRARRGFGFYWNSGNRKAGDATKGGSQCDDTDAISGQAETDTGAARSDSDSRRAAEIWTVGKTDCAG